MTGLWWACKSCGELAYNNADAYRQPPSRKGSPMDLEHSVSGPCLQLAELEELCQVARARGASGDADVKVTGPGHEVRIEWNTSTAVVNEDDAARWTPEAAR